MYIAGIHRVSSSVLYLYALAIGGFTRIRIGVSRYRRDSANRWCWDYTIRICLQVGQREVSHAA